ncbi:MAG: YraN family protein [Balneolaceae bacterium]|nr:YraN family protein [Balneolaceae bacterium]
MSNKTTKEIGNEGEEIAVAYLESKGYTILERNYFFEHAEVDIVAYDESCISFVEVKMRSSTRFGSPEEFVTEQKIENIYKAAEAWLYERKMDGSPVRFDVIAIVQQGNQAPDITHFENAFVPGRK